MRNPNAFTLQERGGAALTRAFAVGNTVIDLTKPTVITKLYPRGVLYRRERRLHGHQRSVIIVLAAEDAGGCGPDRFNQPSLQWAFNRADTVALWGCEANAQAAAIVERHLRSSDRAVLVFAEQPHEDAWQALIEKEVKAARLIALKSDPAVPSNSLRFGFTRPLRGGLH